MMSNDFERKRKIESVYSKRTVKQVKGKERNENGQAGIEVIAFVGSVGGCRVFYFYGVSDMKRLSFEDKLLFSFWGFMFFMCVAVIAAGIVLNEVLL